MARLHLFELHDLSVFPTVWRDLLTDYLSFYAATFKPYAAVAPILADALQNAGTGRIVDLCSGAGQPVLSLVPSLRERGVTELEIVLTDKYPNVSAWAGLGRDPSAVISFETQPVDAADVPDRLTGFRTLFTSFHHFSPREARTVVADAVEKRQGIGIFEYTERNLLIWGIPVLLIPLFVLICTPFIRPFSWRRLFWSCLLPVVPVVAMWDGFVSCLRTYSTKELRALVENVPDRTYQWDIGRVRSVGVSRVTFAVGFPLRAEVRKPADPKGASVNSESSTAP